MHFSFFRLSTERFDKLLRRISPSLLPGKATELETTFWADQPQSWRFTSRHADVTCGQDFSEVHVRLRHWVPVGLSVKCAATASLQWRSMNQASQGSFNGEGKRKKKLKPQMNSTPQRESGKTKRKQEGTEKGRLGVATPSHTVLLCVQHTRFQLHQKKLSFENNIYDLHATEPARCAGRNRFVLVRFNALLSFEWTRFHGFLAGESNGSFLRLAWGAH